MSFSEEWVLVSPASSYSTADLGERLAAILPSAIVFTVTGDDDRTITVTFDASEIDGLAAKLSSRPGQLDWDWRADVDPPKRGGTIYVVRLELVDDDPALLRIDSNVAENRAAWPLVFGIASSLAEDLGAIADEEAPPSSDELPLFIEPGRADRSKPN